MKNIQFLFLWSILWFLFSGPSVVAQSKANGPRELRGRVLEINSNSRPVPGVRVESLGAQTSETTSSGEFILLYAYRPIGAKVGIKVYRKGWELAERSSTVSSFIPVHPDSFEQRIIVCKVGYLDSSKEAYNRRNEKYIKREVQRRINSIVAKTEKEKNKEIALIYEEMERLKSLVENGADEYIRINRDELSARELEAIELFEQGRIRESIELRESFNSEENFLKYLENIKIGERKIAQAQSDTADFRRKAKKERRNIKRITYESLMLFDFEKAEEKFALLANGDTLDFWSTYEYADFLSEQNKENLALPYYNRARTLTNEPTLIASIDNSLGIVFSALGNNNEALLSYHESLEIYREKAETNPEKYLPDVAMVQANLGLFYRDLDSNTAALLSFNQSLEIYREKAETNPEKYLPDVARVQNSLGTLYSALDSNTTALLSYNESLEISRALAETNPEKYLPEVATVLNNLGIFYRHLDSNTTALMSYNEALEIYREKAETNPEKYLPEVAMVQFNLGLFYRDLDSNTAALLSFNQSLEIYREKAETNPEKYLPDVARVQSNLGIVFSALGNNNEALLSYNESLEIYREKAETNPEKYLPDVARVQNSLGIVFKDLGNNKEALLSFNESLEIYREKAETNPEKYLPEVARVQSNLGSLYRDLDHNSAALLSYNEALEIYREKAETNPEKYLPEVARVQINLGLLFEALDSNAEAFFIFKEALLIYRSLAETNFEKYALELVRCYVLMGTLQKQKQKGRLAEFSDLPIERIVEICNGHPDLPRSNSLKKNALELETYFQFKELINDNKVLREDIENADSQQKIKSQKKIISNYHKLNDLGYSVSTFIGNAYGGLAWYYLFEQDFDKAYTSANEALNPTTFSKSEDYDHEMEWVHTNLALALLYLGRWEEAQRIYLDFADKAYKEDTYREVFLQDLKELEAAGIKHPDVKRVRKLLKE